MPGTGPPQMLVRGKKFPLLFENLSQLGYQSRIEFEKPCHSLFHLLPWYGVDIHLGPFRVGEELWILHGVHKGLLQNLDAIFGCARGQ